MSASSDSPLSAATELLLSPVVRLLEALPNFAAPSKLSKNCSRYTVAGSAAGGGTCRYPDVVRQVLL